jgi:hypothetical protein
MHLPAVEDVENAAHPSHRVSHTSHSDHRYRFNQKHPQILRKRPKMLKPRACWRLTRQAACTSEPIRIPQPPRNERL